MAIKREGVLLLEFASVNKQGTNTIASGGARDYSWDMKQVITPALRFSTMLCHLAYCALNTTCSCRQRCGNALNPPYLELYSSVKQENS